MGFSRQRTSQTFRKITRIPYRKPYRQRSMSVRSSRSILSQGGVPGGATRLSPNVPVASEVKFKDTAVSFIPVAGNWNLVQANFLQTIIQGTTTSNRIGRAIKIVGITYRLEVVQNILNPPTPYSIDIGVDKQANSAVPSISDIYAGSSPQSFPNPLFERRFKWMKRLEVRDANSTATLQSGVIKMNQMVNFSASTGTINDMEDANLFLTYSSTAASTITGTIRVNYVDA